ncbi:MAG: aldehyde dehydrogenase family protein [Fuerstiella sp.]
MADPSLVLPVVDGLADTNFGPATFSVVNPATGAVIGTEVSCDADAVARIVESSQRAFEQKSWQSMAPADRGRLLLKLADLVEQQADTLVDLELQDTGKPVTQLQTGEIPLTAAIIRFYAGAADKIEGSVKAGAPQEVLLQMYEPYGVVAGILPWNYPLVNAALKVAPALAAGNAIVLKPAQETPLATVAFARLCAEAGIPPGLVNVVLGSGSTTGQALVDHPAVRKISFTGSTAVGQHIQAAATQQMKKVNLECGGKNALIVFADADLERAAEAALLSGFVNAGQLCVSCSRVLVEQSVAADFEAMLVNRAAKIRLGDPRAADTLVGPMITRSQYDIALQYLSAAADDGQQVLCGGGRATVAEPCQNGFWLQPTIVTDVQPGMKIHDEEIFGPVLSLVKFQSEAEAVRIANSVDYGLSGSVWTRDGSKALRVSRALDTGIVWANTMLAGYPQISLSPHKLSGTGVELGMDGLLAYLKCKSIVIGIDDNSPVGWGLGS